MKILAIDPGNIESAYVLMGEDYKPLEFGKVDNNKLLEYMQILIYGKVVIEMVASYGMAVGATVFETCVWIGKYLQASGVPTERIFRKDVKMNLCGQTRAKDSNIRQALIDRFGVVGTKKQPGWFYGFKSDIWAAYAVGVTYFDTKPSEAFAEWD